MKKRGAIACKLLLVLLAVAILAVSGLALAEDGNLLSNGGFEERDGGGLLPDGWQVEAWFDTDSDRFAMAKTDAERGACAYIINYEDNDTRICQTVSVKPNTLYRISCDIRTEDVYDGAGANVSVADTLATSQAMLGTNEWTNVALVGRTGAEQTSIRVCVRLGGYSALSAGEAWFDNVSVTELSEYTDGIIADFTTVDYSSYDVPAQSVSTESGVVPHFGQMILVTVVFAIAAVLLYKYWICVRPCTNDAGNRPYVRLAAILAAAFVVRVVLGALIIGHPTDINCFMGWSIALANDNLSNFYTSGGFADYPPGYMYVLAITGNIAKLLGLTYGSAGFALLTKMPGILADILAAYIVYRLSQREGLRISTSLALAAVVAFNPVMTFISSAWGQIDQILTLLLVATIYLLRTKRGTIAGAVFGIAIMVKPQALMLGPLLAVAYFLWIKDDGKKALRDTVLGVLAAFAAIAALALPFTGSQEPAWIIDKLLGTATSYPYASVEAFNLFSLFGGNWKSVDSTFFIFSYKVWGTAFIVASVAAACAAYAFGRKNNGGALYLAAAFLFAALFTLGQYMHERYLFPTLLLLVIAFVFYRDKRLFICMSAFTLSMLINSMAAFVITGNQTARGTQYDVLTFAGSLMTVLSFAYFAYVAFDILIKHRTYPALCTQCAETAVASENAGTAKKQKRAGACTHTALVSEFDGDKLFSRRDRLYCWILTGVYAIVALVNLGSTVAPETAWKGGVGDTVRVEFKETENVAEIRTFGGLYTGTAIFRLDDGQEMQYDQINDNMFRWQAFFIESDDTRSVTISVERGQIWLNEVAFFDENGVQVVPEKCDATELIDEQDTVPDRDSYMYGMYFDELYHARTAYEHLEGLSPYENSHPPLGKVFIMFGIAVFGMNPFGWRVVGALFGVGMLPILYMFAKRMFKRSDYALLAAGLFAVDFMHFTQTRIATVDVYAVFFILLMYYFMYRYYTMNFFVDDFRKTLKPLALSGLFFGMGTACKWISIYAGAGLAVILFTSLAKRYMEYRRLRSCGDPHVESAVRTYYKKLVNTLLFCCLFFVAVPVAIYLLSYMPYYLCEDRCDLAGVWGYQEFMFGYHSQLVATHGYQSAWYSWPFDIRPVWYYVGRDVADGNIRSISAFGNPAVWWTCAAGTIALVFMRVRDRIKPSKEIFVIFMGVLANYIIWVLVTRCTFLYHYFATVPFIILASAYLLKTLEERNKKLAFVKWVWLGIAAAMFIMFYPVISGAECSHDYTRFLEWLPGWTFMGV